MSDRIYTFCPKLRGPGRRLLSCQLLVGGLLFLVGCMGQQRNAFVPPPPPKVAVAKPIAREVQEAKEYTGTTLAYESVEIHARVEGFLESIEFNDGDIVAQGQLLAHIDARPYQASLAQAKASLALADAQLLSAQASLESARAKLANGKAEYARVVEAQQRSPGAVSQSEIDLRNTQVATAQAAVSTAEAAIASSEAEIEAGKAEVTKAQLNLDYTDVHSPITGRVGKKNYDVGSLVGKNGATLLTTVVRYDPIHAYFTLSEMDFLRFNRERISEDREPPTEANSQDRPIRLALADEPDFPHDGVCDYGDITLDKTTGTFMARGRFPNHDRLIAPGAFVRIQIPLQKKLALLIDETAVCRDQLGTYLLVVGDDNVVDTRRVTLGGKQGNLRIVEGGELQKDDRIVIRGLQISRPGAKVTPVEESPTSTESTDAEEPPAAEDGEEPATTQQGEVDAP